MKILQYLFHHKGGWHHVHFRPIISVMSSPTHLVLSHPSSFGLQVVAQYTPGKLLLQWSCLSVFVQTPLASWNTLCPVIAWLPPSLLQKSTQLFPPERTLTHLQSEAFIRNKTSHILAFVFSIAIHIWLIVFSFKSLLQANSNSKRARTLFCSFHSYIPQT